MDPAKMLFSQPNSSRPMKLPHIITVRNEIITFWMSLTPGVPLLLFDRFETEVQRGEDSAFYISLSITHHQIYLSEELCSKKKKNNLGCLTEQNPCIFHLFKVRELLMFTLSSFRQLILKKPEDFIMISCIFSSGLMEINL